MCVHLNYEGRLQFKIQPRERNFHSRDYPTIPVPVGPWSGFWLEVVFSRSIRLDEPAGERDIALR